MDLPLLKYLSSSKISELLCTLGLRILSLPKLYPLCLICPKLEINGLLTLIRLHYGGLSLSLSLLDEELAKFLASIVQGIVQAPPIVELGFHYLLTLLLLSRHHVRVLLAGSLVLRIDNLSLVDVPPRLGARPLAAADSLTSSSPELLVLDYKLACLVEKGLF